MDNVKLYMTGMYQGVFVRGCTGDLVPRDEPRLTTCPVACGIIGAELV